MIPWRRFGKKQNSILYTEQMKIVDTLMMNFKLYQLHQDNLLLVHQMSSGKMTPKVRETNDINFISNISLVFLIFSMWPPYVDGQLVFTL